MASLAVVVSHKVNGVSELHSNLMVQSLPVILRRFFRPALTSAQRRYVGAAGWRWQTRRCLDAG